MTETLQSLGHLCVRAFTLPLTGVSRGPSFTQPTLEWCLTLRNAKAVMEAACMRADGRDVSTARLHQLSLAAYKASCFLLDADPPLLNHESLRAKNYFMRLIAVVSKQAIAHLSRALCGIVCCASRPIQDDDLRRQYTEKNGHALGIDPTSHSRCVVYERCSCRYC
jgi:hypothetical protein